MVTESIAAGFYLHQKNVVQMNLLALETISARRSVVYNDNFWLATILNQLVDYLKGFLSDLIRK